jgi:hypothetical protein
MWQKKLLNFKRASFSLTSLPPAAGVIAHITHTVMQSAPPAKVAYQITRRGVSFRCWRLNKLVAAQVVFYVARSPNYLLRTGDRQHEQPEASALDK